MFKKIYVIIVLFIAIFGPKYGFLDTRLFLVILIYSLNINDINKIPKVILWALVFLLFLVVYSFLIYLFNNNDYIDSLRYLRCIFGILLLLHLYRKFDFELLFNSLLFILFLHVLSIYISVIFPSSQGFFSMISGYDKDFRAFRVSGLVAGFDISGIFSLITTYVLYELIKIKSRRIYYFMFFLAYFSIFFTSRTNSVYAILIAVFFFYNFIKNFKLNPKYIFSLVIFFSSFIYILSRFVIPILIDSWNLDIVFEVADRPDIYESGYSKNDPISILQSFIIIPETITGLIFGTSFDPPDSDSGYIKVINIIGILGLVASIIFYISTYILSSLNNYIYNPQTKLLKSVIFFILLITFIASVKNQYFFTRGIFELFIIAILLLKSQNNLYKKYI
jgi:hypothetical protein